MIINTATISGNFCGIGGGGGNAFNATAAAGGPGGAGGGIFNDGSLDLTSCTIASNKTGAGGNGGNSEAGPNGGLTASSGGQGGDGGGILNNASGTSAVIRNTLIAHNLVNVGGSGGTNTSFIFFLGQPTTQQIGTAGADGVGFDVRGEFTSHGFNLIGIVDSSTGFKKGVDADQVGSNTNPLDPLLGPLQMNGGFTPTHELLWKSPAIDRGNCSGTHKDQRSQFRPYIYSSIPRPPGGDGSDIGAFEFDTRRN